MLVVIGLGNIGGAIAERCVEVGESVCGVDLLAERRAEWKEATGLEAAPNVSAVDWAAATRVIVIVRLTDEANEVLEQIDEHLRPGTPVFVSTTLDVTFAGALGRYSDRKWRLLELPISGGRAGARAGELTVMAAGELSADDRGFLTHTIAKHVVHFDRFGEPTLVKLINNTTAAYNTAAFAQMLILGNELGVDVAKLNDVLLTSSGGSWMASRFKHLVEDLLVKDVGLLRHHAGQLPDVSLAADSALVGPNRQAQALLAAAQAAQADGPQN
jgi:putative dehydrogenase